MADFATNAEPGLKALRAGYDDIREGSSSWISRTVDRVRSSLNVAEVGPSYHSALGKMLLVFYRGGRWRHGVANQAADAEVAHRGSA